MTGIQVKQELSSCWDGRPFGHNRHGPKSGEGLLLLLFLHLRYSVKLLLFYPS